LGRKPLGAVLGSTGRDQKKKNVKKAESEGRRKLSQYPVLSGHFQASAKIRGWEAR